VDHPLPINDDAAPEDSLSFFSLEDFFYDPLSPDESLQNGEPASSSNDNLINFFDDPVPMEVSTEGVPVSESISAPAEPPLLEEDSSETSDPASEMGESVPAVPLLPISSMDEEQLTGNNQVEASMPSNEIVQQASDEATSGEPLSETDDCATLHAVESSRFKELPPLDTKLTSLMEDLSAYISPEDYTTHNPIVHGFSQIPSSSRLSPTRTLFPRGESSASDRRIANYTKRLHEAMERPATRSSIAIQTDLESQNLGLRIQEENSSTDDVASTFASPLSILYSSFFQFLG
jgi:hypothetical protein